jgi:hypothetical protein
MLRKTTAAGLIVLGLVVLTGCPSSKTSGPGKGGDNKANKLTLTPEKDSISPLKGADSPTVVGLKVERPADFKGDIGLRAEVAPSSARLKVEVVPTTLKTGDDKAVLKVKPEENAEAGDYTVTVIATPSGTGVEPATAKVKVTVPKS